MATTVLASIGDHGALNASLPIGLQGIWIDRDLSWLDFNERVLAEALDERTPLLERAKFLAIFTSNLDEFFMKREAVLRHGATDAQRALLQPVREKILISLRRQADCYRQIIIPGLAEHGVFLRSWNELTPRQQEEGSKYFKSEVSPALTPLVIDPVHPFPFLSNLSTSLVFRLRDVGREESMFARVKVPGGLKQWVTLETDLKPGQKLLVPMYEIIRGNLHSLYNGMEISNITLVRLTRDAEVGVDDDSAADFRALVKEQIRQRRYEPVVRLEFFSGADPAITEMLRARFELGPVDIYEMQEELDYTTLFELLGLPLPTLRDQEWTPLWPATLPEGQGAIFAAMQTADLLVHHPYESFDASVEHFISTAADDPQTVSIKMTAYRIGDDTPFVKSQSALGGGARASRRARDFWRERAQNPRQDGARGAQGSKGLALLRTHRHRQLPRQDCPPVCRRRPVHLRSPDHRRRGESIPLPYRPLRSAQLHLAPGWSDDHAAATPRSDPA
jgi:polyphosphate kinase